jgi:hypothetical protein
VAPVCACAGCAGVLCDEADVVGGVVWVFAVGDCWPEVAVWATATVVNTQLPSANAMRMALAIV